VSYDQLLEWMSERGGGSWRLLRDGHDWAVPEGERWLVHTAARHLSALGHIEVDWESFEWAAVPPAITLLPSAGGYGLLVGGRTQRLRELLIDELDDPSAFCMLAEQPRAPGAIYIDADDEGDLIQLAKRLEIPFTHSVVEQLAFALPSLDAMIAEASAVPVHSKYGLERYDLAGDRWSLCDSDRQPGFYRYERPGPRLLRFIDDAGESWKVDFALGCYLEARGVGRQDLIAWQADGPTGTLQVPLAAPLPTLHSRSATLCSGLSATRRGSCLIYRNVPEWLAGRIASTLQQELQLLPTRDRASGSEQVQ
jgi:hypothetical protein